MEHYMKGKNVEEPLTRDLVPFTDLPQNFLWMQVHAGSKTRNLLAYALKEVKTAEAVVWSGSGAAVAKVISCAEIMKRSYKQMHQISKICYRKVEEHWDPKTEDLDQLVVCREVPCIHILLSKSELNKEEPGYQPPGSLDVFWKTKRLEDATGPKSSRQRLTSEHLASIGLRTGNKRPRVDTPKQKKANTKPKETT